MLKDITLGQYFPGNSILHNIDPRMKIILSVVYITAIFMADNLYNIAAVLLSVILLTAISGIPAKMLYRSVRPLFFIITFTAVINIFWTSGDHLVVDLGIVKIYAEGIMYMILMVVRITSLVVSTSLMISYTTSPTALTDAVERLLAPLKAIRLPVHEFAMMMTIALRFIPTLIEETDKIINAQLSRGASFYSGSLMARAKSFVPILIPLILSAFRRAEELATAMECRCYRGGEGRTKMKQMHLHARDFAMLAVTVAFAAAVIMLKYVPQVI